MRKGSIFLSLTIVVACMFVLTMVNQGTAWSQTARYKIPIYITCSATAMAGQLDSLIIGVNGDGPNPPGTVADNTYGPDVDLGIYGDYQETQAPPQPQTFYFYSTCQQIPGRTDLPPGGIDPSGLRPLDVRGYSDRLQIDTFCLNVVIGKAPAASGAITLTYPNHLEDYADRWEIQKKDIDDIYQVLDTNMAYPQGRTTVVDANSIKLKDLWYLIIKHGQKPRVDVGVDEKTGASVPKIFRLNQNYPNPFNPTTVLTFTVAKKNMTTLKIYNMLGQEVMNLFNEIAMPGTLYTAKVDGSQLATGVYFYRLMSGDQSDIKKMVLLK